MRSGGTIVEGTAGNTGIGIALVANAKGYNVKIIIPETQSQEKFDTLNALGVELIKVPAREMGPGHTICTILCDSGQRYQSKIWNPEFLRAKGLPVPL